MLSEKIYALQSFQRQFESVLILSTSSTIPGLNWKIKREELLKGIDWNNLLSISSILCQSNKIEHLDAALRICQTILSEPTTKEIQRNAAAVILERLTVTPAVDLAIQRSYLKSDFKDNLPFSLRLAVARDNIENSIVVNSQVQSINKFQREVYDVQSVSESISISAPTSAGKSFILYQIVLDRLLEGEINIVYIVPTRALISQVESDLRILLKANELSSVNITSVPQESTGVGSNVLIFTQERLHWALTRGLTRVDLIIVDEAQKIDDANRGILLQEKLEEVITLNENIRIIFSSPFTSNPQLLLNSFNSPGRKEVVNTQFVSVNQNLIFCNQVPRNVELWTMSLTLPGRSFDLGTVKLDGRPGAGDFKKLVFFILASTVNDSGNLIYANGAAEAEKISLILSGVLPKKEVPGRITELIKLIKKTIHPKYSLVTVLEKGVAFHYGNMPLLIRQEIENLFRDGFIKYLICTSTLLEGVNLPAKTIFIRNPRRGKGRPMTESDFWNLAGRAGRLGKQASGNIICIEPSSWDVPPNPNKFKQTIKKAIDIVERDKGDALIAFISNKAPREDAERNPDLEYAFGYYYRKFVRGELNRQTFFFDRLRIELASLKDTITLPDNIIIRNPGVSPIAQQALLNEFYRKENIDELLPVYPEDEKATDEYISLIARIGRTLSFYPPPLNFARAILVTNWMKGDTLAEIIRATYAYYQRTNKKKGGKAKGLPTVIRECMERVENFVRFQFAKDAGCYIDILRYFYQTKERPDLLERLPDLSLWLEFGVSEGSQISLLSLGLSRSTVNEIGSLLPNSEMDKATALDWLKNTDFEQYEISPIIKDDIDKIIG